MNVVSFLFFLSSFIHGFIYIVNWMSCMFVRYECIFLHRIRFVLTHIFLVTWPNKVVGYVI
jgi:hypothetical protein